MIFVTGGTGFIGTYLLSELLKHGAPVRALKRNTSRITLDAALASSVEWVEGDMLDVSSLEQAIAGCDKIYHCAAIVSFLPKEKERMMKVNAEGTANLVNVAIEKKIKKLVHVSSVAAIGMDTAAAFIDEETKWEDHGAHSHYAISKYLAEREVWRGMAEGLHAVIVNPSLVIGSGDWNIGPPRLFLDTWKGLPAYTSGGTGIVSVEDVTKVMVLLMESEIQDARFILNAENWSFKEFFYLISELFNKKPPRLNAAKWMTEIIWRLEYIKSIFTGIPPLISKETSRIASRRFYYDNSKITDALHFQFQPMKICIEEVCRKFLAAHQPA